MVCSAGVTSSHRVVECVNTLLPSHDLPAESCHRAQDNANDPLTTMDAVEVIEAFAAIPAALPLLLVRPNRPLSPGASIASCIPPSPSLSAGVPEGTPRVPAPVYALAQAPSTCTLAGARRHASPC